MPWNADQELLEHEPRTTQMLGFAVGMFAAGIAAATYLGHLSH